jgi:methionine aminotransferase
MTATATTTTLTLLHEHHDPHPRPESKLPAVGTTIFTVMSALAAEKGAVNLGQGFPDFDCDPALLGAVATPWSKGLNQYPPMTGVPVLREAVATKIEALYGRRYDADREITVTAGATQAILTAVLACVHPGDEVIVLEPCYDSYVPNIELAGGVVVRVPLTPGSFRPDFQQAHRRGHHAAHPRHHRQQPAQPQRHRVDARRDAALADLLAPTDVLLISDEVYEHMVFDGQPHQSSASAFPAWPHAPSSSPASARPTTSPAGRWATWPRPRR